MKKIQLTSGDVYLIGYENTDIVGKLSSECTPEEIEVNATSVDKYYKYPFEPDFNKRIRRQFVIDTLMDIKTVWPWEDNNIDEIIQIASFEHFQHRTEVPHLISEAYRVLKVGGIYKFDFPDVKGIAAHYDDDLMQEYIYGNHKNDYSQHEYGYTWNSIQDYFDKNKWSLVNQSTVEKDYPSIGVWAYKVQ